MKPSDIFTKNFLKLYEESGVKNATALMELINTRAGSKIIDNSYISKMLKKARSGESVNPSIEMASAIATGFNLTLNDIVSEGLGAHCPNFNVNALEKAYRNVDSFCEQAGTDNTVFKARAFKLHYEAIVNGDDDIASKIYLLAKELGI